MMQPEFVDKLNPVEWIGGEQGEDKVFVYTIHDGGQVPRDLFGDRTEEIFARPEIAAAYFAERDWGANLIAAELARHLGLAGYLRVNLARIVMDFGRLPGSSDEKARHLLRYCFFPPLAGHFSEQQKYDLLETHYDAISQRIAIHSLDTKITLAVHSYDELNETGTLRPEISLLSRLLEYSAESTLPPDVFDPLCPPDLLEEAASHRGLTYQILQSLERGGHQTALNYPYLMPAGATEMRSQVSFFFRHLRRHFLQAFPETRDELAFRLVWRMLLDVDQRYADAARLRGFLHRYHGAPEGHRETFLEAREGYAKIKHFLEDNAPLVDDYRNSSERPSSLGLEVRKDLLSTIDRERGEVRPRSDAQLMAHDIAFRIAEPALSFLEEEELVEEVIDNLGVRRGMLARRY
jgi:hypothetical protein